MKTLSGSIYLQYPAGTEFCIQYVVWIIWSTKSYVNICLLINCCTAKSISMFQDKVRYQFLWTIFTIIPTSGQQHSRVNYL